MPIHSKRKGKRGELELSKELTRILGNICTRGQQFKGSEDSPDVVGIPGLHIECKRDEKLRLIQAIIQADTDCGKNLPVVIHRKNRQPWLMTLRLEHLPALVKLLYPLLKEIE